MNRKRRASDKSNISADVAALSTLNREDLIERWQTLYNTLPPARTSQKMMVQAVAYRLQEQDLGGLKPATHRYLEQIAKGESKAQKTLAPASLKPGTRLIREWRGVTYEATILDDGVAFQSKTYRSLSEVARAITGAHWSGPLFFGLKKKSPEKQEKGAIA